MDDTKNNKQVTAIVPAFNEGERLGIVLSQLVQYSGFAEIIVVDDGSTDNTAEVAKKYPITFLQTPHNMGKARAMDLGVKKATTEYIFFCDADISGINNHILDEIIKPVTDKKVEMFIAMRSRKIFIIHRLLSIIPLLGGERALTKKLWERVPDFFKEKFRIEAALNFYAKHYGKGMNAKVFFEIKQTIKEKKYGLLLGLKRRLSMTYDVAVAVIKLQWQHLPKDIINIRLLLFGILFSFLFMLLGLVLIYAVRSGPLNFIFDIFAKELNEDQNHYFVVFLIYFVTFVGRQTLLYLAYFLTLGNFLALLAQINQLVFRLDNSQRTLTQIFRKTNGKY